MEQVLKQHSVNEPEKGGEGESDPHTHKERNASIPRKSLTLPLLKRCGQGQTENNCFVQSLEKVSTEKVKFRAKVYVAQQLMKISSGRELCYVNELLACLIMTNTMIIRNTAKCWDQVDKFGPLIMIKI